MSNLLMWVAILAGFYWFSPSFRRMINGWIVQLGEKVKDDADLPYKPEPLTELEIEDLAAVMFRTDFPNNPDIDKGFEGLPAAIHAAYFGRARAFLGGEDMDEYASKPKRNTTREL